MGTRATRVPHLGTGYYVGWLSAAAIHGAAHQAPQVFQVAVDRLVRDRTVGHTRFVFVQRPTSIDLTTAEHPTRSGTARVSTPDVTALDIATDPALAGGMDNAATVIIELAETTALNPGRWPPWPHGSRPHRDDGSATCWTTPPTTTT